MDNKTLAYPSSTALSSADVAKAALRRLVVSKLEPTPENFTRAFRAESGAVAQAHRPERALALLDRIAAAAAPRAELAQRKALAQALFDGQWDHVERELEVAGEESQGAALAGLIDRIVRGVERGGRQWTSGRRKESLRRVLAGSRTDARLLERRLSQLVGSWDNDYSGDIEPHLEAGAPDLPVAATQGQVVPQVVNWTPVVTCLASSLQTAVGKSEADDLSETMAALVKSITAEGPTPALVDETARLCAGVDRALQHRQHLIDQLGGLCLELTASLGDLAEDDSWAKGQIDAMRQTLQQGVTARGVRSVGELLRRTREQQGRLRDERGQARDALKGLINQMLRELGDLGSHTGRFHESVGRYAEVIDRAESLESLTGVVSEMLSEARSVQEIVGQTQHRLQAEYARTTTLSDRVVELESELRRLSDEVSTDQLTQVANRRGLMQVFEVARAQSERDGLPLAIGLLDVDNFKRLNDELGHSAGDVALRSLAGVISKSLRPADAVARFGGEEFVVLLPATPVADAEQILTRLQRSLSVGLFMHERKTVFVTFSAGVTLHQPGESLERALERADVALYEAKRTGKNRTCIG